GAVRAVLQVLIGKGSPDAGTSHNTAMSQSTRRQFSQALAGAACAGAISRAQTPISWAGESIVDCHHHFRRAEASIAHLDGCGVPNALALARESSAEQIA